MILSSPLVAPLEGSLFGSAAAMAGGRARAAAAVNHPACAGIVMDRMEDRQEAILFATMKEIQ